MPTAAVYTEELEEVLTVHHVTDHMTQAPAVNQLISCLAPLPLDDPFTAHAASTQRYISKYISSIIVM